MLLRNAMRRPRAVEYGSLSWEDLNRQFRKFFLLRLPKIMFFRKGKYQ